MSDPIRIIVADDHPLFREGVINSLGAATDLDVESEVRLERVDRENVAVRVARRWTRAAITRLAEVRHALNRACREVGCAPALYKLVATVPGSEAFQPLERSRCPLVKK